MLVLALQQRDVHENRSNCLDDHRAHPRGAQYLRVPQNQFRSVQLLAAYLGLFLFFRARGVYRAVALGPANGTDATGLPLSPGAKTRDTGQPPRDVNAP